MNWFSWFSFQAFSHFCSCMWLVLYFLMRWWYYSSSKRCDAQVPSACQMAPHGTIYARLRATQKNRPNYPHWKPKLQYIPWVSTKMVLQTWITEKKCWKNLRKMFMPINGEEFMERALRKVRLTYFYGRCRLCITEIRSRGLPKWRFLLLEEQTPANETQLFENFAIETSVLAKNRFFVKRNDMWNLRTLGDF